MDNLDRKNQENDMFEQLGLSVENGSVEVGETYPIFGMITSISEQGSDVVVEINRNIKARMNISNPEKLDVLKKKAFETGIFVSRVLSVKPNIEVECQAVIFGKDKAYNA